jgi:ATP-dependent Clp protease ATP-binding subunit ClpC
MGARPLRRAIQRYIEDPLADFVLGRQLVPGSTIVVDAESIEAEEVTLSVVNPTPDAPPMELATQAGGDGDSAEG